MEKLINRLRSTRLLSPVSEDQLAVLIDNSTMASAGSDEIILRDDQQLDSHLVLLEGELELQRTWQVDGKEKSYTRIINPESGEEGISFITALNRGLRIRAISDVRYLLLNADLLDGLLSWIESTNDPSLPENIRKRMELGRNVGIFHHLPDENIISAFGCMKEVNVSAGEEIIRQGEAGDCFYIIENGEAEIERTDPFTDEIYIAMTIGRGDAFGEEALLQDGCRNATIRMLTPGRLISLSKEDFNELVRPGMVDEIPAEEAHEAVRTGKSRFIDCRYDMEYEDCRIPGAQFIPLTKIRSRVVELEPDNNYIVYCRSGRRSKAAAFLLRERNINAVSMTGGIIDWPYEVEEG